MAVATPSMPLTAESDMGRRLESGCLITALVVITSTVWRTISLRLRLPAMSGTTPGYQLPLRWRCDRPTLANDRERMLYERKRHTRRRLTAANSSAHQHVAVLLQSRSGIPAHPLVPLP